MKLKQYIDTHTEYDDSLECYALLIEIKLDFSNFDDIKFIPQYTGYIFTINNETTMLKGYHVSGKEWIVKFGPYNGRGDLLNVDMKNQNDIKTTLQMVEMVSKSMFLFMKQYKPDNVRFSADRPSRQKLYSRVIMKLIHQSEFSSYSLKTIESDTDNTITYDIYKKGTNHID